MKNIFVGNLTCEATEASVRSLFEAHGAVERVTLMKDWDTGRSRGFAFVEMTDTAKADAAIVALNGEDPPNRHHARYTACMPLKSLVGLQSS